jgi:4-diphosphocytidyl-2-C-methyl-D-erythritol kinase
MAKPIRVSPPAKINLYLRVGPPTADGFHPLMSWMVTVGLFDNLEFVPISRPGVSLECDDPAIPTDASNLIVKTATALLETIAENERTVTGLRAALQKRIPVGAGLGGGSSDGAFALLALNQLLNLNWPPHRLAELSAQFGSDLPFFFHGPSSICTSRGEIVNPTPPPKPRWALLILPKIQMPTPAVYRRFDEMKLGHPDSLTTNPNWRHWSTLPANDLLPLLINDLEPPAFDLNPTLAKLHKQATQSLERIIRMSGSGSTLFTLYDSEEQATQAATQIQTQLHIKTLPVQLCPS